MANEERKLTRAEAKRLDIFNEKCTALLQEGYVRKDLTAGLVRANLVGALYGVLLAIPFIILYFVFHPGFSPRVDESYFLKYILFMIVLFVFIIVHELLHGFTWSRFSKNGFKDIAFGIIWASMNPYCTCKEPLTKRGYFTGLLMPCLILGIVPSVLSWFNHNGWFIAMGAIMIISAGGDLLIGKMILQNKTSKKTLYLDHPTSIGLAAFEK